MIFRGFFLLYFLRFVRYCDLKSIPRRLFQGTRVLVDHNTRMGRGRPIPVTSQDDDTSDGTVTSKRTKNLNSSCPICERAFEPGQESIICDGDCQKFIHRQCASLTKHQFKQAGESDLPYFCVHCTLSKQNSEITNLKQVITELTDKINSLTPVKPVDVHSAVQLPVRISTILLVNLQTLLPQQCNQLTVNLTWSYMELVSALMEPVGQTE